MDYSGEKRTFGTLLGFQIRHFSVAVLREHFGELRGRTDFWCELQSCRRYSDLEASQIS